MSFSDVEHFSNMVTGCESITAGDRTSGDARYAFAVLKLHTVDMGSVAGQEGFLDNVKAGAAKTGEFIKKLFEAIKKWFSEAFKSTRAKAKHLFGDGSDEEKDAARKKIATTMVGKIESVKKAAEGLPEEINGKEVISAADKALSAFKEDGRPAAVLLALDSLLAQIDKVSSAFITYCNKHMPKKQMDPHAPYDKAVKEYKSFAEPVNKLTSYIAEAFGKK
jgi:hypothetical protein